MTSPVIISFRCHRCNSPIRVSASYAGRTGKCRACKADVHIPQVGVPTTQSQPSAEPDRLPILDLPQNETSQSETATTSQARPNNAKKRRLAFIVAAALVGAACAVALAIVWRTQERHKRKTVASLDAMLTAAISDANDAAGSYQFDVATRCLGEVQQKIEVSPYARDVKPRLNDATAHLSDLQREHVDKLKQGFIVYKGRLIPPPPLRLAVGSPIPGKTIFLVGYPSNMFSLVIENSTTYCRYIELTPLGESDWKFQVWPRTPGELLIRQRVELKTKTDVNTAASGLPTTAQSGLPEFQAPEWLDQPYEIRDRTGNVMFRFPPEPTTKNSGELYADSSPYVSARWLAIKSFAGLLNYRLVPGQTTVLYARSEIQGVAFDAAKTTFADLASLAVLFENRMPKTAQFAFPSPDEVLVGRTRARALFLGFKGRRGSSQLDEIVVTKIRGKLGAEVAPYGSLEFIYLMPPHTTGKTVALGSLGQTAVGTTDLHRQPLARR
jgi:hypothetical protein